jgi:hypothetical protein
VARVIKIVGIAVRLAKGLHRGHLRPIPWRAEHHEEALLGGGERAMPVVFGHRAGAVNDKDCGYAGGCGR